MINSPFSGPRKDNTIDLLNAAYRQPQGIEAFGTADGVQQIVSNRFFLDIGISETLTPVNFNPDDIDVFLFDGLKRF